VTTFEWGMKKWDEGEAVASTLGAVYLRSRGISVAPPDCLKFHPAVRHTPTKQDLPALLALATNIQTGSPLAVQCTYLARDGNCKAKVERKDQRRTFGSPKGGAVKLAEPADGMPLILGEGVETTATAIEATGYPGWATLGTSGFVNIELPDAVREIILLAENDESGANQKALDKICPVLTERGIRVRIARPPEGVNDFNDLVKPEGSVGPHAGLVIGVTTHGVRNILAYGIAKPDSIFEIGSISKTFTGLMLARMIEQGLTGRKGKGGFYRLDRSGGGRAMQAIDLKTGATRWQTLSPSTMCAWGAQACAHAQSQAVTVIPGVAFSGSMDGHLRAYSTIDGKILWDYETAKDYSTVNGVRARGGSLDQGGATIVNGVLYVNSGYGQRSGQPGNVLLALSVGGK